ncbi:GGDEF domain-containing protein [Sandaracinus amylolyticus]|uniref:diguanylate cyclase n=1 Tax=Sandaracinus amylolyticus TaxID=927083 RepID=A0A0F6YJY9_9BACT|nr:GGDEF domain-containing protein [Sandaracinus amylolyticus]AKF07701.1 diguanylate cyclase/phosphodiesterase (GGDEF & EAL domains) with PAS/PAC sensor(s) [Sandaracinus amylolyticus]
MAREDDETGEVTIIGQRALVSEATLQRDRAYLVVIAGANVGEMYPVGGGLVIGRGADADIRVMDDEISRRHARIAVLGKDILVEDLGSKNGTFLNGTAVRRKALQDGDKIQVGATTVLRFSVHDRLEESFQRHMYESALRDPLTRAYNRKYLLDRLQSELAYAQRHASPLSLLLFDVDHFKRINDTYGHPAGDAVLVGLSRHVLRIIRTEDVFSRYGGEEFGILSRGIPLDGASRFAERLRTAIEGYPIMHDGVRITVTVSVGVTAVPQAKVEDPSELVVLADRALYQAKHQGRNRVCVVI